MKFNFLSQLQQEASKLNQERKETLEPLLREGLALLTQAEAENFQNLTLLKQAAQQFLKAQQGNQRDLRPYLFVAYVFLLLNDPMRASAHLNLARRQDPNHPLVKEFSDKLIELSQQHKQKSTKPAVQKQLNFSKDKDPEQLHDHLHQAILSEVLQLQAFAPPQPDSSESELERFASVMQQARQNFEQIQEHMFELDRHIDTYELKSRLRPLEILLKRNQVHIQTLQEIPRIQTRLDALRSELNQAIRSLETELISAKQRHEQQLEQFLDRLDALADQIDELENKGLKNSQLEKSYEFVMHRLEDYQDQLDSILV